MTAENRSVNEQYGWTARLISKTKVVMVCMLIGATLTGAAFLLAGAAPRIFGVLALPFWILPGLLGFGAHDTEVIPLLFISGFLFYGMLSFGVFRLVARAARGKAR